MDGGAEFWPPRGTAARKKTSRPGHCASSGISAGARGAWTQIWNGMGFRLARAHLLTAIVQTPAWPPNIVLILSLESPNKPRLCRSAPLHAPPARPGVPIDACQWLEAGMVWGLWPAATLAQVTTVGRASWPTLGSGGDPGIKSEPVLIWSSVSPGSVAGSLYLFWVLRSNLRSVRSLDHHVGRGATQSSSPLQPCGCRPHSLSQKRLVIFKTNSCAPHTTHPTTTTTTPPPPPPPRHTTTTL